MNTKRTINLFPRKYKVGIIVVLTISFLLWFNYGVLTETAIIKINKMERDDVAKHYLVFATDLLEGKEEEYKIEDTWIWFRLNSSHTYGKLAENNTYKVRLYGIRWYYPTSYKNIVTVFEEIK